MKEVNLFKAEYIWLDGGKTQKLRSKTRVISINNSNMKLDDFLKQFPVWQFDGSSTGQAEGDDSDCLLQPVRWCFDPGREGAILVLCEVLNGDGTPHKSNERAKLKELMKGFEELEPWIGFEQEYTLFKGRTPLGWPEEGFPGAQGPYYCSVGADVTFGREIAEKHLDQCLEAGLSIYGINAEVMPGQWEFQIGYRGLDTKCDPLTMSDDLWIARYLLNRIAEEFGVTVKIDCKPIKGDWNGAGMHTNYSTTETRHPENGYENIVNIARRMFDSHEDCISKYGEGLKERLTGAHETCSWEEFKFGVSDRTASIRIPRSVYEAGHGYFEDRRPGANANPYVVSQLLLEIGRLTKTESYQAETISD